ncbi:MAG: Do family serine endopeptidase [Candidatus Binatia bacterium]
MYRLLPLLILSLSLLSGASSARARDPLPSFAPVLRDAEPAVVNIATIGRDDEEGEPETMQDLLHRFYGEPRVARSLGSGFVISDDGEIVTNHHVVAGADRIRVRLANDEELDARLIGADDRTDIALLRVSAGRPLPTLPLGDSDALEVGDWVLAIGNPFGLSQTATVGIVSAKGRFLGAGPYDDFIQTDASINPGNSGGPLLDLEGRVVGINAAIVSPAGGSVGIGFAVPIKLATWVIGQLREHGRVVRGSIGIAIQPVTPELARSFGLRAAEGALVADVTEGAPAQRGGIRRGDVIVRWADRAIRRARDLPVLVAGTTPGSKVVVDLLRDGQQRSVEVVVGELQAGVEPPVQRRRVGEGGLEEWGLVVRPLDEAEARRRGFRAGGLVVVDIDEASPAEDAGLEPGDVIVQANRQAVRTLAELRKALGVRPHHALLLVRRGTASIYVELDR